MGRRRAAQAYAQGAPRPAIGGKDRLYCLTHANILSQSGVPDRLDRKCIGHYSTLKKALAARERAARLPGFSGFPAGFAVELIFCADGEEGAPPRLKRWRPAKSSSAWTAGRRVLTPVYIHDHEFAALSP